jgi:hypothetical protein
MYAMRLALVLISSSEKTRNGVPCGGAGTAESQPNHTVSNPTIHADAVQSLFAVNIRVVRTEQ